MQYFSKFPYVSYISPNGTSIVYRNLLTRISVIPSVEENPLLYYTYDIMDGETPEIISEKYYGDPYNYWIILLANQILDPQWDWPLSTTNFANYINDKYTSQGIDPNATVKAYLKNITYQNTTYNTTNTTTLEISQSEYESGTPSSGTLNLPTETVNYNISYSTQSYYDYEYNLNESKRTIKVLNKDYVSQIQNEFVNLLS